ncbi:MAG: hypothetical protein IJJ71_01095 [Treponema sp.]|uniref:TRL domain-containing protein n=1 Tax=Treponema sp. TaxID=166 RepID=UPI001B060C8E|nr:TRL domain-containing protein [Treponema sp.]MBO6218240.1 hypothetical protein [Treponema sp.]MBR0494755.1 hypothetical protein [Treponema sp.]
MKKLIFILFAIFTVCIFMSGCTTTKPGYGFGSNAVISDANMEKRGEATGVFLFGIPIAADASMSTAAENGGITKIATIDTRTTNILGIFIKRTTIVTGE